MRSSTAIGLVILTILVLLVLYNFIGRKEGFTAYDNNLPIQSHANFVKSRQSDTNLIMSLQNMMSPILEPSPQLEQDSLQALNHPNVTSGGLPGEFKVDPPSNPLKFKSGEVDIAAKARFCQEFVRSADCSVWDPPADPQRRQQWQTFIDECGLSLDKDGTNFQGEKHMGGLYVGSNKKRQQLDESEGKSNRERYFKPTLGTAKTGLFSLDKKSCDIINERIRCKTQKTFDAKNCSNCYTQDSWERLDDESARISPDIFVGGEGTAVTMINGITATTNLTANLQKLNLPKDSSIQEGQTLQISLSGTSRPNIYGYIAGPTQRVNPFKFDLFILVDSDAITGQRPITNGFVSQDGMKMNRITVGSGKNTLKLIVKIPFSFIDTSDYSSTACDNGPFVTQKASADFLNSNPCFGPSATPGNYSIDCLKDKFLAVGGTNQGTGYPKDAASLRALNYNGRTPRDIGEIGEYLYDLAVKASTGRDQQGNMLSINDWNNASMFLTGKRITSPCHGQNDLPASSISQECLQFIYRNQGQGGDFGSTYTASFTLSSLLGKAPKEKGSTYCQPGAPLDPSTQTGKDKIKSLNGVQQIKDLYNNVHAAANNNNTSIFERTSQIKDCYNIDISEPKQEEIYWAGPGYDYTFEQASEVAKKLGGQLANYQQVYAAWVLGASWCSVGWTAEGFCVYPINEPVPQGCGSSPGVQIYYPGKAGAIIYGIKPDQGSEDAKNYGIAAFNTQTNQWNSNETFLVLDVGYDKTKAQATQVCSDVGATVATKNQLEKSYKSGSEWCGAGWVSDADNGFYPMQEFNKACGLSIGLSEFGAEYAPKDSSGKPMLAVNCHGRKPNKKTPPKKNRNLRPFYTNTYKDSDSAYSTYDYYKTYRPIPLKNVGLVHPYYFAALIKNPQKVQIMSASLPGVLSYNSEKITLIEKYGYQLPLMPDRKLSDPFTFTIYPTVPNMYGDVQSWERCSAAGITKHQVKINGDSEQKQVCESQGKCYNEKAGIRCFDPVKGNLAVYIRANNDRRISSWPSGDILATVTWDGPWEAWFLEPVPGKSEYVTLRSFFGKYLSVKGINNFVKADADTIGPNEQFAIIANLI